MISKLLLLLLPSLALASIQISVNGDYGDNEPHVDVYFNGNSIDVISDRDMQTFGINDDILKSAVEQYFNKRPTDVFVKSPTPFGDLFNTFGWHQVQRIIRPISAKVLSINSEPTIVLKETFENNSTKSAIFNVGISEQVQDTVSSHWFKKQDIIFDAKSDYSFNLGMSKGGVYTELKYNAVWGEDYMRSNAVTVGATSALQVMLEPGKSVQATLMATKTTIKVQVEYDATLSGELAVNYQESYKGHHFWSMDVDAVTQAAGINNKVVAKEDIELNYFWNSKINVHDGPAYEKMLLEVNY